MKSVVFKIFIIDLFENDRFMFLNLLLNSHSLNIPKVLRPNVDNHYIQDKDEFHHYLLLIHQNNMDNENILIHRTLYHKMNTFA